MNEFVCVWRVVKNDEQNDNCKNEKEMKEKKCN